MKTYVEYDRVHPLAMLFPEIVGAEFDKLVEDIGKNGLIHPIIVHHGALLDGRNRLRACEAAGVAPWFTTFESLQLKTTPEAYIWAVNSTRRHLNDGQRAQLILDFKDAIAAEGQARMKAGRSPAGKPSGNLAIGSTRGILAQKADVSQSEIRRAEKIKKNPELATQVREGKIPALEAAKQLEAVSNGDRPVAELLKEKAHAELKELKTHFPSPGIEITVGKKGRFNLHFLNLDEESIVTAARFQEVIMRIPGTVCCSCGSLILDADSDRMTLGEPIVFEDAEHTQQYACCEGCKQIETMRLESSREESADEMADGMAVENAEQAREPEADKAKGESA